MDDMEDRVNAGVHWVVGFFIAGALGTFSFALGRLAASNYCDGACPGLSGLGESLSAPFFVMGDTLSWLLAAAILVGVFLWAAIGLRRYALAFLLLLGLAALGAMISSPLAAPNTGADEAPTVVTEPDPLPAADDADEATDVDPVVPAPEAQSLTLAPEPETPDPSCDDGAFWNGTSCVSCTVTERVPAPPAVTFDPVKFGAAWAYAKDSRFVPISGENGVRSIDDLVIDGNVAVGAKAVCASAAVLVVGSASSDGPLARNRARSIRRARRLADHIDKNCPDDTAVFAISLGQSVRDTDLPGDRALAVIGLSAPEGGRITPALIERELGYLLNARSIDVPQLKDYKQFPQAGWQWVRGSSGVPAIIPAARPFVDQDTPRDGAPRRCAATPS